MQFHTCGSKIITDEHYMETLQHGTPQFPFAFYYDDLTHFDFHCAEWHWHDEFEFACIERGAVICWVGEDQFLLPPGWGLFINSKVLHRFYAEKEGIVPNFLCLPSFIAQEGSLLHTRFVAPVTASSLEYVILDPGIPWQSEILSLYREITTLCQQSENCELLLSAAMQKVWHLLFQNALSSQAEHSGRQKAPPQARLQMMLQYIHTNYRTSLSLDALCSSVHISKSSALHLFSQILHTTPIQYLVKYRLQLAAKYLTASDQTVSQIAMGCGFSSVDYFCKSFKKHYGMTPTQYRKSRP